MCSDAQKPVRNRVFTIMDRQNFPPAAGLTSEAPESASKIVCSDAQKPVRNLVFIIMDRQNFPPAAGYIPFW